MVAVKGASVERGQEREPPRIRRVSPRQDRELQLVEQRSGLRYPYLDDIFAQKAAMSAQP